MNSIMSLGRLAQIGKPVITTTEAALVLGKSLPATSQTMLKLVESKTVTKIRRGLWAIDTIKDPLIVAPYLTAPYSAYGSFWTALSRHDMIEQIPQEIHIVSLDRAQKIHTIFGTFCVYHITKELYGGFTQQNGVRLATKEKALFDTIYLLSVLGSRHVSLIELTLSEDFDYDILWSWVNKITSKKLKTMTKAHLERVIAEAEIE
ncbi:MAG: type IV toxin-antitoxin system AbiEi family antitoxin domain-containing protein [Patescibacteria group bacterium]